jgi:isoquinoline 1-oxidoreductase beta subunit
VVVGRRAFLQLTGLTAGALILGVRSSEALATAGDAGFEFDLFLSLDSSGAVTIAAHRSEMGQGIRTALPMVVADEMEADFDRVEVVQALADERYGSQNTRRIPQRPRLLRANAHHRRFRPSHAGRSGGNELGSGP